MGLVLAAALVALPAFAAPSFPKLTGRVVDEANILSPQTEADLTQKLATLEDTTGRQLVVVTLPSLQGYEIEDYGYQLGRHWSIGREKEDDGALFVVAPSDRKVRIEVGYGLEPVLTDALSSVILQSQVLPRFRDGDMEGGVVAGTDAILEQLSLPDSEAKAKVAQASESRDSRGEGWGTAIFVIILIFFFVSRLMPGRRRRRSGLASALPWIILGSLGNGRGGGGGWSGGGGGWGGGGGGSFGGGGSSGSW
ncbi:TPM domain-containing protein [Caulobacter segnis]|uniref:TPM domain-containing protein n=1 Tax=Caulobacter segnis TaxID=88688 RepID=UPI0024101E48|nr:TPM domain-containing protein [Caulobacter segnis]MDG2521664.1 TPM domain-containing protein [Caulobacter segnis]